MLLILSVALMIALVIVGVPLAMVPMAATAICLLSAHRRAAREPVPNPARFRAPPAARGPPHR